jgi:hypothetical protein
LVFDLWSTDYRSQQKLPGSRFFSRCLWRLASAPLALILAISGLYPVLFGTDRGLVLRHPMIIDKRQSSKNGVFRRLLLVQAIQIVSNFVLHRSLSRLGSHPFRFIVESIGQREVAARRSFIGAGGRLTRGVPDPDRLAKISEKSV